MLIMLGIPNCDSVKKAQRALAASQTPFIFRDVRRQPLSASEWRALVVQDPQRKLVNVRSPSFRKTGVAKEALTEAETVVALLADQPTAMKRPVLVEDGQLVSIGLSGALLAGSGEARS